MKHIKTFESYVYESEVNETLHEASHAGRAWSGKIKNIDNLLSWMYDKGILNKTEQAEKDRTFRQYYRYYNDGDIPQGLSGLSDEKIELHIEKKVEEFIKKILAKYTGKYDRRDFRIDTLLGDLNTLRNITAGHYIASNDTHWEPDPYGLLNYWGKSVKTGNSEFEDMLAKLRPLYDDIDKATNEVIAKEAKDGVYKDKKSYEMPNAGHTIGYRYKQMKQDGVWTPELDKKYNAMKDHMMVMAKILDSVIEATQKLKEEIPA
jgi:hypothetical protein